MGFMVDNEIKIDMPRRKSNVKTSSNGLQVK